MKRCRHRLFVLPVLALIAAAACAVNPVTGRRQLMLVSPERELELGREADTGITASYGLYGEEELGFYLDELGQRMARICHRPELEFSFKILDTPVINAFAVPGGFVYVTRGILAYLNSEAELTGVLGHELGHITARHTAQRLSQATVAGLGIGLGSMFSETFSRYSQVAEAGVGLLMLSFSRANEREADRLGVEYSSAAGWDAAEMAAFFATLERMSPKRGGGLPDWFSTHPAPEERVDNVRRMAREARTERSAAGGAEPVVNRTEYLQQIAGLVYGADPRQGYIAEGTFYHPELRFLFPVPTDWTVLNEARQVQLTGPQDQAVILFTLGTGDDPEAEADTFLESTGLTPRERSPVTVNGLRGVSLEALVEQGGNEVFLRSLFIGKGERTYLFHGLCEAAQVSRYSGTFATVMQGFAPLTDRARIEVEPERLQLVETGSGGTLRRLLLDHGVSDDRLEEHSLLNGRLLEDRVEAGSLLKIIRPGGR